MGAYTEVSGQTINCQTRNRDSIDVLYSRVEMLSGMDKVLMTMRLKNGASFRQISKLTGMDETSIARRVRRLSEQLLESEYFLCLRNRKMFSGGEMNIARDYFLRDLSIKEIARRRNISRYHIHKTVGRIERLIAVIKKGNQGTA